MALNRCCGVTRKGVRCSITSTSRLSDDGDRLTNHKSKGLKAQASRRSARTWVARAFSPHKQIVEQPFLLKPHGYDNRAILAVGHDGRNAARIIDISSRKQRSRVAFLYHLPCFWSDGLMGREHTPVDDNTAFWYRNCHCLICFR